MTKFLISNMVSLASVIGAVFLAYHDKPVWMFMLFFAWLTHSSPKE